MEYISSHWEIGLDMFSLIMLHSSSLLHECIILTVFRWKLNPKDLVLVIRRYLIQTELNK